MTERPSTRARRGPNKKRVAAAVTVLDALDALYPSAQTELDFRNDWELLAAVILSAQCTDRRVNLVTPALFAAFPTPEATAAASPEAIEPFIATCGLWRAKARNLHLCARQVVTEHEGRVPGDRAALEALAGVGRKTANVVLSNLFGEDAIAVDTHVFRVARRLGWSRGRGPLQVEQDLMALLPRERWTKAHHTLIWHGRRCCAARTPACDRCPVRTHCPGQEAVTSPS